MISDQTCGLPIKYAYQYHIEADNFGVRNELQDQPLTSLNTVERIPERHLTQRIESGHFEPLCHVETFCLHSIRSQAHDELVDCLRDDVLLLHQYFCRERGR